VVLAALLIAAVIVGALSLVGGGRARKKTRHPTTTTTTTRPSESLGIGLRTVTWTDTNPSAGLVVNPGGSAGPRTLVTEIWYPSIAGSKVAPTTGATPDYRGGPFPVILFAHGFDTLPNTYASLLVSWVRAGFVVVAPVFPDENANKISSLTNPSYAEIVESDVVNEPYDLAYVLGKVESGASGSNSSGAPWLKGLAAPGKVALAGHSDGAQVVAALVYSQTYASTYAAMAVQPFAVVILSGSELSGTYAPPASAPPMLFVQSAVDACNLPQDAGVLFHDAGGGFFLKLTGAHHFSPYVGQGPAAPVVAKVTIAFLKAAVAGTPSPSALSSVVLPSGIATLYAPSTPPALTALPEPTQQERAIACAVPTAQS